MGIYNRREFVKTGATVALVAALPRVARGETRKEWKYQCASHSVHDARTEELAMQAIDAARQSGATYADVQLTYTRTRDCEQIYEHEELGIGVRALVDGYWGFASGPYWHSDGAARAGREAVALAKANTLGKPRVADLGPTLAAQRGDWTTPVEIDPFEVPLEEARDWIIGTTNYTNGLLSKDPSAYSRAMLTFIKQQHAFASTEGAYLTQTFHTINVGFAFEYLKMGAAYPELISSRRGWEYVYKADVRAWVPRAMAAIEADLEIPVKALDIGRYDTVFSAPAVAALLNGTLGPATQLDRALGYEANASGTSYLGPNPMDFLGKKVGSSLLNVSGDRSTPTALATVKWDAEGVEPVPFPIVKDGVLVDYQTTREQAYWLAEWYQKNNTTIHSHGCASAPTALSLPLQHTPNLSMTPGAADEDFETLIAGVDRGIAVRGVHLDMDHQHLSGFAQIGGAYEIKNGKRVSRIGGPGSANGFLFRSPELWNSLAAIGGTKSVGWFSNGVSRKGEPSQMTTYSIGAVPALIKNIITIDATRRG